MLYKICVGYYSWDNFFAERKAFKYAKENIHPKSEIVKTEAIKEVSNGMYKVK